jgi:hypothetical protein
MVWPLQYFHEYARSYQALQYNAASDRLWFFPLRVLMAMTGKRQARQRDGRTRRLPESSRSGRKTMQTYTRWDAFCRTLFHAYPGNTLTDVEKGAAKDSIPLETRGN